MVDDNNIIVPGLLVKTKFLSSKGWITNIIESVEKDVLRIPLVEQYFNEEFLVDDDIVIEFVDSRHQYKVDGKILDVDIVNSQTMRIKVVDFSTYKNKRKSRRHYTSLGASVSETSSDENFTAIITNVSSTGICFVTKRVFDMGVAVSLKVMTSLEKITTFRGKIVRFKSCNSWYEYAIELENNLQLNIDIQDLIYQIERETTKLRDALYKKFSIYLKKSSKSFFSVNILLGENSSLVRMIIKSAVNNAGITNISEASNAVEVMEKVKKFKPDIVCISNIIYEVENNKIFDEIYKINPKTKILLLSSNPEDAINPEIELKYKVDYIPKSFSCDKLIDTIKHYWK